jgi:hypothetical protein
MHWEFFYIIKLGLKGSDLMLEVGFANGENLKIDGG